MHQPVILSAIVLTALAAALSACGPKKEVAATAPAPAASTADVPQLWNIEVMSGDKAVSATEICADSAIRKGFARPAPEVSGQPCIREHDAVEKGQTYSARCHVGEQAYAVSSVVSGDVDRDFKVEMAVKPLDRKNPTFEQVRRYHVTGACPQGWTIGDSAAPGARQLVNALSGRSRPMPAAGG